MDLDLDVNEAEIADFEVVEEGQRVHREWVVPAGLINTRGRVRMATEAEEADGSAEWFRRAEALLMDQS